jgi:hypothetical protein
MRSVEDGSDDSGANLPMNLTVVVGLLLLHLESLSIVPNAVNDFEDWTFESVESTQTLRS